MPRPTCVRSRRYNTDRADRLRVPQAARGPGHRGRRRRRGDGRRADLARVHIRCGASRAGGRYGQAASGRSAEHRAPGAAALAVDARAAGRHGARRRRRCAAGAGHRRVAAAGVAAERRRRGSRAGIDGRHARRLDRRIDIADDGGRDGRGQGDAAGSGRGDGRADRRVVARRLDGAVIVGRVVAEDSEETGRDVDRARRVYFDGLGFPVATRRPVDLEPASARRMDDGQDARRRQHGQGQARGQQQDGREDAWGDIAWS